MNDTLVIEGLSFELRRSARRKTVGITIERDGKLILSAPPDCSLEQIEQFAREKQTWIYTRLAEKGAFSHPVRSKEFVNGEGFYYLGRSYRLKLVDPDRTDDFVPVLRLHNGRFLLRMDERPRARAHFIAWYTAHGHAWLQRKVALYTDRIGVTPPAVEVRDLGYRWGLCSQDGRLDFHWRAILLPPRIVEYLIVHELVHLRTPHHSPDFWRRLERALPDFAGRKQWLAENGGRFYL